MEPLGATAAVAAAAAVPGSGPGSGLDPARTRVHPGLLGWLYYALLAWVPWVTDWQPVTAKQIAKTWMNT